MNKILIKYNEKTAKEFLKKIKNKKTVFLCTIAHTETSKIPGVSAAGASQELIEYTPAADVEAIYYGKAFCLEKIPENPFGPPSPVIITMASLKLLKIPVFIINAGVKIKPKAPMITVNEKFGKNIENGDALKDIDLNKIYEFAKILAKEFSKSFDVIIFGESVPGGTTTAMALINAIGVESFNQVSGSMPTNNHNIKAEIVKKALIHIKKNESILDKVKKICDPMQPFQAFFTLEASKHGINVMLAGGSQMIAVSGLIKELEKNYNYENICIATTKWVTEDRYSDLTGLMKKLNLKIPLISSNLDFSESKYKNLQLYEEGYVKEGVGAGALACAVFNDLEISNENFLKEIEKVYENIYMEK